MPAKTGKFSTFIVGGTFRLRGDHVLVQKRSWEMLRIFADQMAVPVFGMQQEPNNKTLECPLPSSVSVMEIPNVRGRIKLINTLLRRGLTPENKEALDECYAVLLRQPLWECWDVFRYAVARKKKVLVSYHGDWPDALRRSEAKSSKRLLNLALAQYIHHVYKRMARQCEVSFCVGEALHKKYGTLAKKSVTFANFLHSVDNIATPRLLNTTPPYRILFVGGYEEYKGVRYLVQAAAHLRKKGFDFKLTLVGTGSLAEELRILAQSEGVSESVEWRGYVQYGDALMQIYREADVLVLPSIASEGTAKVLMEAMSQCVPVIATDVGSARHLLEGGTYGMIVPPADAQQLASAIQTLLTDASLRSSLITRGLDLARASTNEKQRKIVRMALEASLPEILGIPDYLASLDGLT